VDELDSVTFLNFPHFRFQKRNGETGEGDWIGEDVDFELDLGPKLHLYAGKIRRIQWREAGVPEDPATLPGLPTARPSDPAGSEPSVGLRSIPGFVWIPPGRFTWGSPVEEFERDLDEEPPTEVAITRGFWMGRCEVTQAEYKAVTGANPSQFVGDAQRPVEKVSWREAVNYCTSLTQQQEAAGILPPGHAFRLPTEAEWEYACRAGTTTRFSYGDDLEGRQLDEYAWFSENSDSITHPVGLKKPNPWGLQDMHGNVLEWCLDHATGLLPGGRVQDYRAPAGGSLRVTRGGSWLYSPKSCRSANRDSYGENSRCSDLGFRVVLAPAEP
jgi:formylglycine-generating enzyme required for sulfatase activity